MLLLSLLLLVSAADAQPRCPGKETPALAVHPFRSLVCSKTTDVSLSTGAVKVPALPRAPETAEQTLERLAGSWEGWASFGMQRVEVLLVVAREGKGWSAKWITRDHKTLRRWPLEALIAPSGSKANVSAWLATWPKLQGKGALAFGSQSKDTKVNDTVLVSDKEGTNQLATFTRRGSKLDVSFQDLRRPSTPMASFTLEASKKTSLD